MKKIVLYSLLIILTISIFMYGLDIKIGGVHFYINPAYPQIVEIMDKMEE